MSALKIKDDQGNWINLPGLKGDKGDKGDKGESGVYLGTTAPSDEDINVWINPNGEAHTEAIVVDPTLTMEGQAADAKVTGDRINSLNYNLNDVYSSFYKDGNAVEIQENTSEYFSLYTPNGDIHVNSISNPIYTGTVNIIDLIGLAQGVFTDSNSGVTIEISGNEIYIHGTTTAGFRFNLQTGEFFTDSFTNHIADYSNLPNGSEYRYCFWEKTGYTMPNNVYTAVRSGATGNITANALSNHTTSFLKNDVYAQYFAIYSNGAITDLNVKFTIGLKISALTASLNASIEQVAKAPYNTTVITGVGYYELAEFTWTGENNIYDIVSTVSLLQPDPLTYGKKIAWFGDSISQLKELPNLVSALLNVTVYDCTFAGSPLTYGNPTLYQPTGFMSLCSQIVAGDFSDLSDALTAQQAQGISISEKLAHLETLEALDFDTVTDVVIFAGTNDFDNDYVNATNFVSGFTNALTALLTAYPHLMVYVFAPIWRGDKSEGVQSIPTMSDLVNLEKQVADAFCLPFYDLYHRSGINALTASVYLQSDILHPSDAGDVLLANKCAKFIQSN